MELSAARSWVTWSRSARTACGSSIAGNLLPLMVAWFACGAVVLVTLFVVWMTFLPGLPTELGFTLRNYSDVFTPLLFRVIPNTAIVGFGTVAVSLFFGVSLALLLHRTNVPLRQFWITIIPLTVIVPGFLTAMGWLMLLSPKIGLINKFLMLVFDLQNAPFDIENPWGVAFVQGLMLTPVILILLTGPVRSLDPALEEAAQVAGVNRRHTIWGITLPMLWPAILGGAIYTFMTAIAIFEVAYLIGGIGKSPVLATELFLNTRPLGATTSVPRFGIAGVYGVLIIVPSLIALAFYFRVIEKGYRYVVVTGKGYVPKTINLGKARYFALLFVLLYFSLAVAMPLLMLLWASLLPYLVMPSVKALSLVSLRWYGELMDIIGGFEVIWNTFVLMISVPLIVMFFSFMISWIVVRTQMRGRRVLDMVAMLPHAIPGLAFAFALFMLAIVAARWVEWFPFYQTIGIVVLANALNRLSYATRITNAALLQVGRELEEAAEVSGVRRLGIMWWVLAPLIRPSLLFGAMWTGLLAIREITMALMLSGPENQVISVQIWSRWDAGDLSEAAALGVVMVFVLGALVFIIQKLTGRHVGGETRLT